MYIRTKYFFIGIRKMSFGHKNTFKMTLYGTTYRSYKLYKNYHLLIRIGESV